MACGASRRRDDHSSCTPVARRIKQPTRTADPDRSGIAPAPFLFGLAPGGVCRAASVAGSAVRSYRTVSPLPRLKRNAPRRSVLCGTVPRVLSPPDVIRHRLSVEPGLSSPAAFRHWRGAAVQPTDVDRNGDMRGSRQGLSRDSLKKTVSVLSHTIALEGCGEGRVSINARNVSSVEGSAMPSTRACRKWRWNAVTIFCVASS